jgi:hypothetical protein
MQTPKFPRMLTVRQKYRPSPPVDIETAINTEMKRLLPRLKPGMRVAVGTGSRGISNILPIVSSVVEFLKRAGAKPFLIPAMGSHGGATPEGQLEVLASYGITEALGVPIAASMETIQLGRTADGLDVIFSAEAKKAGGIIVINRIKPHTDFQSDALGSGVLKMLVIGLGKHAGAANYHRAAIRLGFEPVIRSMARLIINSAPVLGGIGIVEDQFHQTARIAFLPADEMERSEAKLFAEAKALMPKLPFDDIDLLVVDRLGKNISGSGMDPNIIGREVHGYSSLFEAQRKLKPSIGRIFVRDLTPETHGNAIGIGLADFTTSRLVREMDPKKTYINALTSLATICAKVPIHFETDHEAIAQGLHSLAIPNTAEAKVVRIADTLSLHELQISEGFTDRAHLDVLNGPAEMRFDSTGNLL